MSELPPSDAALQFYYFGLYRALKRYRFAIIFGWAVVFIGCASVPLGCEFVGTPALVDLTLSCCTVVAGLALVQQGISSLAAYINVPFPIEDTSGAVPRGRVDELIQLMKDIDEGGWQEAHAAIRTLKEMASTHGLPALN
jgi:hypothetical protein